MIQVNFSPKISPDRIKELVKEIKSDPMGGWMELPSQTAEVERILEVAEKIRQESDAVVFIGIGGSYLGHRAIIEALRDDSTPLPPVKKTDKYLKKQRPRLDIVYAGNSLSQRELDRSLNQLGNKDFSVIVISKSGTTLEPARAFDAFKKKLAEKYGVAEAMKRVYCITDKDSGELHQEAVRDNYTTFVIPNSVGGRYSVLSPVGLLPMAVAGIDIKSLLEGAKEEASGDSAAVKYAFMRHALSSRGYDTEVFATFEPSTTYFNEWIKQLFGESEGKDRQGVFPASVVYSTDLHSLGQFMQDGRRTLWETIIDYPTDELNQKVVTAVQTAHMQGRIPVLKITVPTFDEKGFGQLIYFFELACAISAKLHGVNPFDQPGVETYKEELRKLMPGSKDQIDLKDQSELKDQPELESQPDLADQADLKDQTELKAQTNSKDSSNSENPQN